VYLASQTAAEHAFETTRRYLESELKLQVNLDKSGVARASARTSLVRADRRTRRGEGGAHERAAATAKSQNLMRAGRGQSVASPLKR